MTEDLPVDEWLFRLGIGYYRRDTALPWAVEHQQEWAKWCGMVAVEVATMIERWPRGRCEFWTSDRTMCGKPGRWLVAGQIRCGEHKVR